MVRRPGIQESNWKLETYMVKWLKVNSKCICKMHPETRKLSTLELIRTTTAVPFGSNCMMKWLDIIQTKALRHKMVAASGKALPATVQIVCT